MLAHIVGSDELKLVVSVDGDRSVAMRKGSAGAAGGGERPILSWETRARQVLAASISTDGSNRTIALADAVTIHGPNDATAGDLHASVADVVAGLKPDVWSVYYESEDILGTAPHDERLAATKLVVMRGRGDFIEDNLVGQLSTTSIANRIRVV